MVGVVVAAAAVLWAEAYSWRASRQDYPERPESGPPDGEDVVLVLGFPPRRDGTPGFVQRWRTRVALRSAPRGALFVFTGAAVQTDVPEADVMADLARGHGIPDDRIVRERTATTTRENLARSLPWLETARTIRIASNTFHARRARRHLRERQPTLFLRLRPTRDFRPFEVGPLRVLFTAYDAIGAAVAGRRDRDGMPGASAAEAPR
ncbi:MAG: YdcF family protein [Microbacterium sp.]